MHHDASQAIHDYVRLPIWPLELYQQKDATVGTQYVLNLRLDYTIAGLFCVLLVLFGEA